jgi:hypothetical protein
MISQKNQPYWIQLIGCGTIFSLAISLGFMTRGISGSNLSQTNLFGWGTTLTLFCAASAIIAAFRIISKENIRGSIPIATLIQHSLLEEVILIFFPALTLAISGSVLNTFIVYIITVLIYSFIIYRKKKDIEQITFMLTALMCPIALVYGNWAHSLILRIIIKGVSVGKGFKGITFENALVTAVKLGIGVTALIVMPVQELYFLGNILWGDIPPKLDILQQIGIALIGSEVIYITLNLTGVKEITKTNFSLKINTQSEQASFFWVYVFSLGFQIIAGVLGYGVILINSWLKLGSLVIICLFFVVQTTSNTEDKAETAPYLLYSTASTGVFALTAACSSNLSQFLVFCIIMFVLDNVILAKKD